MYKFQKFWTQVLRFSQILTLPLSFWGILLSPVRAVQITGAVGNWYFWLILAVTATNTVMYYQYTWGLNALERDLGLYFALVKLQPYRPLRLKLSRKLAMVLLVIGVVPAAMLMFVAQYERLLPVFYDWVTLPLSLANLVCCVLFLALYVRAKLYLKQHQQEICWYECKIPWFFEKLLITTYGCCPVCELERNLAEVQLSNFLMVHDAVRVLYPELDARASRRMADQVLSYIDNL